MRGAAGVRQHAHRRVDVRRASVVLRRRGARARRRFLRRADARQGGVGRRAVLRPRRDRGDEPARADPGRRRGLGGRRRALRASLEHAAVARGGRGRRASAGEGRRRGPRRPRRDVGAPRRRRVGRARRRVLLGDVKRDRNSDGRWRRRGASQTRAGPGRVRLGDRSRAPSAETPLQRRRLGRRAGVFGPQAARRRRRAGRARPAQGADPPRSRAGGAGRWHRVLRLAARSPLPQQSRRARAGRDARRSRREPPSVGDRDGARVRARTGPRSIRRRGAASGARAAGRPRRPRRRRRRRADTEPPRALRAGLAPPQLCLPAPQRLVRRPGARGLPVRRAVRSRFAGVDATRQRRRPERVAHEADRPRTLATGLCSRRGLRRHETSAAP